jgi:SAM-dependent methyltransferase
MIRGGAGRRAGWSGVERAGGNVRRVHGALDLVADDQYAFVKGAVGEARRVLEVGAGRGALARRLQRSGVEVTAVDLSAPADDGSGVRWIEGDFLELEDDPFDAVAFTTSLHHIAPLDAALDKARRLLTPGGVLVLDEFDLEAPDEETCRWYYELQELLAVAGAYDPGHVPMGPSASALGRWRADHEHDGAPLHTGRAMLAGVEKIARHVAVTRGPYLYRYICGGVSEPSVARHVKAVEERRVAEGSLRAVGLRVVARGV